MGCWNGTDFITQLPIFEDQEVVLFLIKKKMKTIPTDSMCYHNEMFKPFPVLLYGKYDDYGAINEVTGDLDLFYEIIEKELDITENDVEDLCKKHYGGYENNEKANAYLRYMHNYDKEKDIDFVLMHKALFDKLKDVDDFYDGKEKVVNEYYNKLNIHKIEKELQKQGLSQFEIRVKLFEIDMSSSNMSFVNIKNLKSENVNKDTISHILSIECAMIPLRKFWFPQSGAGSQCMIDDVHKSVLDFYSNFLEDYKKRYECE